MTPEWWRQVEALYHAAAARPLGNRTAWLAPASLYAALRREVESLLDQHASKASALESGGIGSGSD